MLYTVPLNAVNEMWSVNNMSATKNAGSGSAPLQNVRICTACSPNPVLQFKSASEVAEYRKRKVVSQYYTKPTNVFPIKKRYASMFTTFKRAEAVKGIFADGTCCNNGQLTPLSDAGKDSPAFLANKANPT